MNQDRPGEKNERVVVVFSLLCHGTASAGIIEPLASSCRFVSEVRTSNRYCASEINVFCSLFCSDGVE